MIDWNIRFSEQLKWTYEFRSHIYRIINLETKTNLLEIGCGTGALLKEIGKEFNLNLYGIDIDEHRLKIAKDNLNQENIKANLQYMDILNNNFEDEKFEVIITHYLFLWIKNLEKCFTEIHRILKKEGILLILAEPDYGGVIESPETGLKDALISNLKDNGADPEVGRKMNQYFSQKFEIVERYCISVPWISSKNKDNLLKELKFFEKILTNHNFENKEMNVAIENDKYFLFIPIFSYILKK